MSAAEHGAEHAQRERVHRSPPGQSAVWRRFLDRTTSTASSSPCCSAWCSWCRSGWRRARPRRPAFRADSRASSKTVVEFVDTPGARHLPRHQQAHRAARAHHLLLDPADEFHGRVPVDLLPLMGQKVGLEHLKVVPTTDLNITLGMSITVFLIVMFYSFKIKGFRRLRLGTAHASLRQVDDAVQPAAELHRAPRASGIARPASVRQPLRRRNDLPAARRARRQLRHHFFRRYRRRNRPAPARHGLGRASTSW